MICKSSANNRSTSFAVMLMIASTLGMPTALGGFVYRRENATLVKPYEDNRPTDPHSMDSAVVRADDTNFPANREKINAGTSGLGLGSSSPITESQQKTSNLAATKDSNNESPMPSEQLIAANIADEDKKTKQRKSSNPPELPEQAKELQLGKTVDLLALFDPAMHTSEGRWEQSDGKIVSDKSSVNTMILPYQLPEKYIMRIRARRVEGNDTLFVRVRLQDRQTDIAFNAWYGTLGGIEKLDGLLISDEKNESRFSKPMIGTGKSSDIVIISNKKSILVTIDGKTAIDWQGKPSRLSIHYSEPKETFAHARLTAVRSSWEISRYSVTPIEDEPRLAVPGKDQIEKITRELEDRYSFNSRVIRASDKLDFAKRLKALSVREKDPESRYVLLSNALENASEAGDLEITLKLLDQIGEEFEINQHELFRNVIEELSTSKRDPKFLYELSLICSNHAWEAADNHEYSEAVKHCSTSLDVARKSRLRSLVTHLQAVRKLFEEWDEDYASVASAHASILKGSATGSDHLSWGKFLCFARRDWNSGLPHLKQGDNDKLSQLAETELQRSMSFDAVIKLIQQWLETAKTFDEQERQLIEEHARSLSTRAIALAEENQLPLIDQYARELFAGATLFDTTSIEEGILIGGAEANPPTEATIEFWGRTVDPTGGFLLKREQEPHDSIGMVVDNGNAVLIANGSLYFEKQPTKTLVSDGRWHHMAVTKVGNRLRMFVDGIPVADLDSREGFPKPNDSQWRLGLFKWNHYGHLAAQFARVRISSVSRYHTRFLPQYNYKPDRVTIFMK